MGTWRSERFRLTEQESTFDKSNDAS